jgi:hypothetical protein
LAKTDRKRAWGWSGFIAILSGPHYVARTSHFAVHMGCSGTSISIPLSTETRPGALGMGGGPARSAGRRPAGVAPGAVAGSGGGLGRGHLGPSCRTGSRVGVPRVGEPVLTALAREAPCGHDLPPARRLGARPSVRPGCGHGRCSLTPTFSTCPTTVPCRSRIIRPSTGAPQGTDDVTQILDSLAYCLFGGPVGGYPPGAAALAVGGSDPGPVGVDIRTCQQAAKRDHQL